MSRGVVWVSFLCLQIKPLVSHSLALGVMDSGAELAHSFHLFRWFPGCGSAGLPLRADSRVLSHCGSVLVFAIPVCSLGIWGSIIWRCQSREWESKNIFRGSVRERFLSLDTPVLLRCSGRNGSLLSIYSSFLMSLIPLNNSYMFVFLCPTDCAS